MDSAVLQQLQAIITKQEQLLGEQAEQLRGQAQTIESLTNRVEQLEENTAKTEATAAAAQTTAQQAIDTAQASAEKEPSKVVTSGNEKVKLAISGQVNRAVNIVDDGHNTDAYFVDNDVSNSRVRLVGTGDLGGGTTVGARFELAFAPDESSDVSQDNEESGTFFDERKVEVFFRNDDYGQLSIGKGSTASDNTAQYDLSLVGGPIMYASIADPVAGMQFRDGNSLTGITVASAFTTFDGPRASRVLYDSPVFGPGFQLSGSASSNNRWELAVNWGGDYGAWSGVEIGDFVTIGAVSISDPNKNDVDFRLAGSSSTLHKPTGLSLTLSGGMDHASGEDPFNLYGKIGWDTEFFDFGKTGFGIDFTHGENICGQCDEGNSFGFAALQKVEDWGLEFYSQFRWFGLDTEAGAPNTDDIYAFTVGTRAKF